MCFTLLRAPAVGAVFVQSIGPQHRKCSEGVRVDLYSLGTPVGEGALQPWARRGEAECPPRVTAAFVPLPLWSPSLAHLGHGGRAGGSHPLREFSGRGQMHYIPPRGCGNSEH